MPQNILDCQKLPCPEPVLRTKKFLASGKVPICAVIVDNLAAKENVSRFLRSQGYEVFVVEESGLWHITGKLEGGVADKKEAAASEKMDATGRTLIVITSSAVGSGDDTLGAKLMNNFLLTLQEMEGSLWRVILLNAGVKLVTSDSPCLAHLQLLEKKGIDLLVCGTCLEHFSLMSKKVVGQTTNMLDVVTSMQLAHKVITI